MLDSARYHMAWHALARPRILAVTLMAVALSACGGSGGGAGATSSPGTSQTVPTAGGNVKMQTSAGTLGSVQVGTQPAGASAGLSTPFGWLTFDITGLTKGASITLTFTVPSGFTLTGYEKCSNGSCSALSGATVSGSTLTVTLTDGGSGDADGAANGTITDPGAIIATPNYTIGGTLSGLSGTVVLQDNGGDNLSLTQNGSFQFATSLASGAAYDVTVLTQPSGLTCLVENGSGTATSNVSNVAVSCTGAAIPTGTGGTNTAGQSGSSLYLLEASGTLSASGGPVFSGITNSLLDYSGFNTTPSVPYSAESSGGTSAYSGLIADAAGNLWAVQNTFSSASNWGEFATAIVEFPNASGSPSSLAPTVVTTLPADIVVNNRLAIDAANNIWVDEIDTNDSIEKIVEYTAASSYATTGTVIQYSGLGGSSSCLGASLAFTSGGNLVALEDYYDVNSTAPSGCSVQIVEYTPAGNQVTNPYYPGGYGGLNGEIAIDAAGNLWIFSEPGPTDCHYPSCTIAGEIYEVSNAGVVLQTIALPDGMSAEFTGAVFDANGNLWFNASSNFGEGDAPCSGSYTDTVYEIAARTASPATAWSYTGSCTAASRNIFFGLAVAPLPSTLPQ